ncbi:unnamed protein product [Calypogeia fissa]
MSKCIGSCVSPLAAVFLPSPPDLPAICRESRDLWLWRGEVNDVALLPHHNVGGVRRPDLWDTVSFYPRVIRPSSRPACLCAI